MIRFLRKLELRNLERLRDERYRRRMLFLNYALMIFWMGLGGFSAHSWYTEQMALIGSDTVASVSSVSFWLLSLIISFTSLLHARSDIQLIYLVEFFSDRDAHRLAA